MSAGQIKTGAVLLPALTLMAGCATMEDLFTTGSPPPPQQVAAAPQQLTPPSPNIGTTMDLNGTYAGTLRKATGASRNCGPSGIPASATVANGQIAINLGRYGSATGSIGGDGTAELTGTHLSGHATFAGTRVSGELQRYACPYTLNLTKRTAPY